jgi:hypothetical protein
MVVKSLFFIATNGSSRRIANIERKKKDHLLVDLKGMVYCHYHQVKNCMTWCHNTMKLCLVFYLVNKSFLVLV